MDASAHRLAAVPARSRLTAFALFAATALAPDLAAQDRPGGEWVGAAPVPARRIWSQVTLDRQVIWLRRTFRVDKPITAARIVVTCDNSCEVWINGRRAANSAANWQEVVVHDITAHLAPGDVTLAVQATNDGGPGVLALWCQWTDADGDHAVVTDEAWRVSNDEEQGWTAKEHDDRQWAAPRALEWIDLGTCASGGPPERVHFRGPIDEAMEPVLAAIAAAKQSQDPEQALRALERVERALADARQALWTTLERRRSPR